MQAPALGLERGAHQSITMPLVRSEPAGDDCIQVALRRREPGVSSARATALRAAKDKIIAPKTGELRNAAVLVTPGVTSPGNKLGSILVELGPLSELPMLLMASCSCRMRKLPRRCVFFSNGSNSLSSPAAHRFSPRCSQSHGDSRAAVSASRSRAATSVSPASARSFTSSRERAMWSAEPKYEAVLFDLLSALLDSGTLWNAVAGSAETAVAGARPI